jgi:hypothetical protein
MSTPEATGQPGADVIRLPTAHDKRRSAFIALPGENLAPDAAAWSMFADLAEFARELPGLSPDGVACMDRMHLASLRAAGMLPAATDFTQRQATDTVIAYRYGDRSWNDREAMLAGADSIKHLDLPPRYLNPLLVHGLCTIPELVELMKRGERELMALPRIGNNACLAIQAAVEKFTDGAATGVDSGGAGR